MLAECPLRLIVFLPSICPSAFSVQASSLSTPSYRRPNRPLALGTCQPSSDELPLFHALLGTSEDEAEVSRLNLLGPTIKNIFYIEDHDWEGLDGGQVYSGWDSCCLVLLAVQQHHLGQRRVLARLLTWRCELLKN